MEKKPRLGIKLVIEAEVWERYTRQLESKGLTAEEADEKTVDLLSSYKRTDYYTEIQNIYIWVVWQQKDLYLRWKMAEKPKDYPGKGTGEKDLDLLR